MKWIRTSASILLSLLVLMASSHFYVGLHRCGDHVNAVAFLQQADGCGHAKMPPCHRALMKDCCQDDQVVHQAQDLKVDVSAIHVPAATLVGILHSTVVLADLIPVLSTVDFPLVDDSPPRASDRTVLHAVFLI
jgi:hypothetical protein